MLQEWFQAHSRYLDTYTPIGTDHKLPIFSKRQGSLTFTAASVCCCPCYCKSTPAAVAQHLPPSNRSQQSTLTHKRECFQTLLSGCGSSNPDLIAPRPVSSMTTWPHQFKTDSSRPRCKHCRVLTVVVYIWNDWSLNHILLILLLFICVHCHHIVVQILVKGPRISQ